MSEWHALVYGVIQGLTEFLPVSSSGHLALLPHFLQVSDPGVAFDLCMHLGTAFAVILYFWRDLYALLQSLLTFIFRRQRDQHFNQLRCFVLATLVSGVLGLFLKSYAESFGRNPKVIAINLFVFGLFLYLSDRFGKSDSEGLGPKKALCIGLFQALAVFPGVSRSGITISMGRVLGLDRASASRFSFLLSLPLIFAGMALKSVDLLANAGAPSVKVIAIGTGASFFVGLLSIHLFLQLIKSSGLGIYLIYRSFLAVLLLLYL